MIYIKIYGKTIEAEGITKAKENQALYLDCQTSFVFRQLGETYCSQSIDW